jgi:hypothetical protein
MWGLIGAIIGGFVSIGTAIAVEYLRRPNLILSIEKPPCDRTYGPNAPATNVRFLRVKLFNEPLPSWAEWMVRAPALQCRATITFHHLDGQNHFGRSMDGRWASTPEPVPIPIVNLQGVHQFQILDFTRLTLESRIDVYPGESELLDIAARLDNDDECYGWNNGQYLFMPLWRNPNWQLAHARYLVKVIIASSGQKCLGLFRLVNNVSRTDFRLEPATQQETDLLTANAAS